MHPPPHTTRTLIMSLLFLMINGKENILTSHYQSSIWEQLWQDNIHDWRYPHECRYAFNSQTRQLKDYEKQKCPPRTAPENNYDNTDKGMHPWCYPNIHDSLDMREDTKTPHHDHHALQRSRKHLVFIGDSLTRYRYLDLVYRTHFPNTTLSPEWVINEKLFLNDWAEFYKHTTDIFDGAMECDCYRNVSLPFDAITENRYYTHPQTKMKLTYIQWFGYDRPLHGHISHHIRTAEQPPDWSGDILYTVKHVVSALHPTHIIFNAGYWAGRTTKTELTVLFNAVRLLGAAPLWVETSPAQDIVRNRNDDQYYNSNLARDILIDTYVEFPSSPKPTDYWNRNHFRNSSIYKEWNDAIMQVIDKQSLIWSYFAYTDFATGVTEREYIEPLVGNLFQPTPHCGSQSQSQTPPNKIPPKLQESRHVVFLSSRNNLRRRVVIEPSASSWNLTEGAFASLWTKNNTLRCVDKTISVMESQISASNSISSACIHSVACESGGVVDTHNTDLFISTRSVFNNFLNSVNQVESRYPASLFTTATDTAKAPPASSATFTATAATDTAASDVYGYFVELRREGMRAHVWHSP